MSVIISTPQQIHNHPLNRSTSKAQYSFPKAKRADPSLHPPCSVAFYDLPPVRSTRAAGIGYSTKYDFTKVCSKNPAPNAYQAESKTDHSKRGFSFGLSREQMAITGGMMVGDRNSPGPGAYNVREINKAKVAYSFRSRATADVLTTNRFVPGPGAYNPADTLSKTGKYFISKYHDSKATTIAPRSKRDDLYQISKTPGPGAYEVGGALNSTGSYFVSKFRSSLSQSFSRSLRDSSSLSRLSSVPGPGSYRLPSEFGHYESKNAKKFEEEVNSKYGSSTRLNTTKSPLQSPEKSVDTK